MSEPDCRVAGRVACHEECTDQPGLDWTQTHTGIAFSNMYTRDRQSGVEDCCLDADYDTVVLLHMSVGPLVSEGETLAQRLP